MIRRGGDQISAAVASDERLDLDVPVLGLNDHEAIAKFVASSLSVIEGKS